MHLSTRLIFQLMRSTYRNNRNISNRCPKHKDILVETNYIKFLLVLFLIVNSMSQLLAQPVYTKDNKFIWNREDFVDACVEGANSETVDLDGFEIDMEDYCSCFCDKIIPNNTMSEIEAALEKGDMTSLFLREDNLELLIDCASKTLEISNDFQYKKNDFTEVSELTIKRCVGELMNDPEMAEIFTQQLAYDYCFCTYNKLMSNGFTYEDIQQIEDENSEAFNEITLPCLTEILNKTGNSLSSNNYNSSDIVGYPSVSRIKLVDYLNVGYKIEISIDGITKYYLFDTGASDLIIDRDMERELLLNG
jgi:hypothetical protein